MTIADRAGDLLGRAIAPFFRATSAARHARTFHPRGDLARADVSPCSGIAAEDQDLADRLSGEALVRLSSALAREVRKPDVLGCALRFASEQDLLFATIKHPWTMPFAPFTTRVGDYFANHYYAVTPFEREGKRMCFRLRPERGDAGTVGGDGARGWPERRARLAARIRDGRAAFVLEIAPTSRGPWRPLVDVELVEMLDRDPPALAFDAFNVGAGVVPVGFVHALRSGVYAASRRPRHANA